MTPCTLGELKQNWRIIDMNERPETELKAVNIRLPLGLIGGLKREAKRRGINQSQLIRLVLSNFVRPGSVKL